MTTEEKFNAAVNVIRSLPKNGSYQPSNSLMLKFYAYFKQATEGPCTGKRPAFYDVVRRAKHDAWASLGNMPKSEAMALYVEELHTIVETMSFSDNVANFLEAPTNEMDCLNLILDDLEVVAGDVLEKVRSQPNSPLASREASPIRISSTAPTPELEDTDHSDDEYIDTIEYHPDVKKYNGELSNGYGPREHLSRSRTKTPGHVDISQEISKAVQSLRVDIERLTSKINTLEHLSVAPRKNRGFFGGTSIQLVAFIIAWPFVATYIMNRYMKKK